jgi:hypothetical protein
MAKNHQQLSPIGLPGVDVIEDDGQRFTGQKQGKA